MLLQRKTDYHCHILPGIDDGPSDSRVSIEMARLLSGLGYQDVHCTPHLIKGLYEVSVQEVLEEIRLLQLELDRENIDIRLLAGREHYLDEFLLDFIREPQLLEGTNSILIEIPSHSSADFVKDTLFAVRCRGYVPLIAHPERCKHFEIQKAEATWSGKLNAWMTRNLDAGQAADPGNDLLTYLKSLGCQFQANLGSKMGLYGNRVRENAQYLEQTGIYTHEGTDAHSPDFIRYTLGLE